jgi:hypothetical protein
MIAILTWKPQSKGHRTDKNFTAETAESAEKESR